MHEDDANAATSRDFALWESEFSPGERLAWLTLLFVEAGIGNPVIQVSPEAEKEEEEED